MFAHLGWPALAGRTPRGWRLDAWRWLVAAGACAAPERRDDRACELAVLADHAGAIGAVVAPHDLHRLLAAEELQQSAGIERVRSEAREPRERHVRGHDAADREAVRQMCER